MVSKCFMNRFLVHCEGRFNLFGMDFLSPIKLGSVNQLLPCAEGLSLWQEWGLFNSGHLQGKEKASDGRHVCPGSCVLCRQRRGPSDCFMAGIERHSGRAMWS